MLQQAANQVLSQAKSTDLDVMDRDKIFLRICGSLTSILFPNRYEAAPAKPPATMMYSGTRFA